MKIAVCIRGELRTWKSCYENIFNTFPVDTDYFFTTWNQNHNPLTNKIEKVIEEDIVKTFSNRNLVDIEIVPFAYPANKIILPASYYMAYLWYKSSQLKRKHEIKNKFEYDCVIGIRPDVVYAEKFGMEIITMDDFTLYTDSGMSSNSVFYGICCSDIVICGKSFLSDIVSDFYLYIKDIGTEDLNYIPDLSHNTLSDYLNKRKITISTKIMESLKNEYILRFGVELENNLHLTDNDRYVLKELRDKWDRDSQREIMLDYQNGDYSD